MKVFFVFLSLMISNLHSSQKASENNYMFEGKVNLGIGEMYVVPVERNNDGMFVTVNINGKNYKFLIDSGASASVLDSNLFEESGTSKKILMQDAFGKEFETEQVYKDFKLGSAEFSHFAFLKQDFSAYLKDKCYKFDGILGANVLKKLNWKYSIVDDKLYFSSTTFSYEGFQDPIKVQWYGSIPLAELRINNYKFLAIIDTGHFGELLISEFIYKENFKRNYNRLTRGKGILLSGIMGKEDIQLRKTKIPNFAWGKIDLADYEAIIAPAKSNIGNKIIFGNDFIFNFLNDEIAFGTKDEVSENGDLMKIKICKSKINPENLEICFFWDEPANKSLRIGDQVIQVDDINTKKITSSTYCELMDYIRNKRTPKNLTIERGGKQFQYVLN